MNLLESIRLAFGRIGVNKLRSFLTMLGIIIGISAVITITTIGNSLKKTISTSMNELGGSNLISAYLEPNYPDDMEEMDTWVYPELGDDDYITDEWIDMYKNAFPDDVKNVIVQNELDSGKYTQGKNYANVQIHGTSSGYLDAMKINLVRGRDLSEEDYKQNRHTAVVSDLFVKYACPDEEPIGKEITVNTQDGSGYHFVIVGVYEYDKRMFEGVDSSSKTSERDKPTTMFIPASTANKLSANPVPGYDYLQILSTDTADPTRLSEDTANYFNDLLAQSGSFQMSCYDMASELDTINNVLDILTIAISIIAAISLVVGGVGVMNIMLVSIIERTKEIGIRKALGAKNSNIRLQFLTESVILCLIGGTIGILIGVGNGFLLGFVAKTLGASMVPEYMNYLTVTVQPSVNAIIISVVFSMLIGIVFGYYPAKRAAKLSPIDALRYE